MDDAFLPPLRASNLHAILISRTQDVTEHVISMELKCVS
jgi:hypothetical protein